MGADRIWGLWGLATVLMGDIVWVRDLNDVEYLGWGRK